MKRAKFLVLALKIMTSIVFRYCFVEMVLWSTSLKVVRKETLRDVKSPLTQVRVN